MGDGRAGKSTQVKLLANMFIINGTKSVEKNFEIVKKAVDNIIV